jgi:biotin carboxylase
MTDVLMIGFGRSFLRNLDGHVEPGCVRVVEEPDVYRNKRLDRECYAALGEVVLAEYQQHDGFLGAALDAHGRRHVQAVIPGIEYAVEAAAAVAARLARPGASPAAARILRDKLLLRQVSSAAGIANPAWAEARSPEDVVRFMTASGAATGRSVTGRRSVLKPANRQASLGVCFLDDPHDVDGAWAETVNADEGPQLAGRPMRWRYLVEERIDGPEFSVEAFVRDGNVGFANITEKIVDAGSHPVELGHVIPAPLSDT